VPKPAHAKPFARRTWLQRRVPHCPMCGVAGKTDYVTPGAARERVDPVHCAVKLVCRWCLLSRSRFNTGVSQSAVVVKFTQKVLREC